METEQLNTSKNRFKRLLVISLLSLFLFLTALFIYEYLRIAPREVHFTNITSSSVTVSWNTKSPISSCVIVNKDKGFFPINILGLGKERFYDTRDVTKAELEASEKTTENISNGDGMEVSMSDVVTEIKVSQKGKYYTHHVTVKNLDPESEYSFMIGDELLFKRVKDINSVMTVSTNPVPDGVVTPVPAYGSVKDAQNKEGALLEDLVSVNDAIVYFNYLNNDTGERSNYFSSTLNEDGNWYVDVSGAVDSTNNSFLESQKNEKNDNIYGELVIDAGPLGMWKKWQNGFLISPVSITVINMFNSVEDYSVEGTVVPYESMIIDDSKKDVLSSFTKVAYAGFVQCEDSGGTWNPSTMKCTCPTGYKHNANETCTLIGTCIRTAASCYCECPSGYARNCNFTNCATTTVTCTQKDNCDQSCNNPTSFICYKEQCVSDRNYCTPTCPPTGYSEYTETVNVGVSGIKSTCTGTDNCGLGGSKSITCYKPFAANTAESTCKSNSLGTWSDNQCTCNIQNTSLNNGKCVCNLGYQQSGSSCVLTKIDGVCGSNIGDYSSTSTSWITGGTFCKSGNPSSTPQFPKTPGTVTWTCQGIGGGANSPICQATRKAPVEGVTQCEGKQIYNSPSQISCVHYSTFSCTSDCYYVKECWPDGTPHYIKCNTPGDYSLCSKSVLTEHGVNCNPQPPQEDTRCSGTNLNIGQYQLSNSKCFGCFWEKVDSYGGYGPKYREEADISKCSVNFCGKPTISMNENDNNSISIDGNRCVNGSILSETGAGVSGLTYTWGCINSANTISVSCSSQINIIKKESLCGSATATSKDNIITISGTACKAGAKIADQFKWPNSDRIDYTCIDSSGGSSTCTVVLLASSYTYTYGACGEATNDSYNDIASLNSKSEKELCSNGYASDVTSNEQSFLWFCYKSNQQPTSGKRCTAQKITTQNPEITNPPECGEFHTKEVTQREKDLAVASVLCSSGTDSNFYQSSIEKNKFYWVCQLPTFERATCYLTVKDEVISDQVNQIYLPLIYSSPIESDNNQGNNNNEENDPLPSCGTLNGGTIYMKDVSVFDNPGSLCSSGTSSKTNLTVEPIHSDENSLGFAEQFFWQCSNSSNDIEVCYVWVLDLPEDVEKIPVPVIKSSLNNINKNHSSNLFSSLFSKKVLGESITSQYIIDPQTGILTNIQEGSYTFDYKGETYSFTVDNVAYSTANGLVLVYIDENNNQTYDENIDIKISDIASSIEIVATELKYTYKLEQGYNFVSFPFIVSNENFRTAASLLKKYNEVYDDVLYSISKYDGTWRIVGQNDEVYSSNDFQLIPGQGYVIKAKKDFNLVIFGKPVKYDSPSNSAPISLFKGWNLIGIYGTNVKKYTAKTMLQDINAYKKVDFSADNVSKWESDTQMYEGYQMINEEGIEKEYGFDFPINILNSYFVKVQDGMGNWQPELAQ